MSQPQQVVSQAPVFGVDYDLGYVGFVFHDDSFISKGIVWFTRWDRGNLPPVSHTLVVSGEDKCVEANSPGVQRASLSQYFNDPHMHIFFRKPQGYTEEVGAVIVKESESHVGEHYDYPLIGVDAAAGSFLGHFLNRWTNNWPNRILSSLMGSSNRKICSGLVAVSLQAVDFLHKLGCLVYPFKMITPMMLAADDEVFVPMQHSVG